MFVYIRNDTLDLPLTNYNGDEVIPVAWWWERMWVANDTRDITNYVFFALSLAFTFLVYLAVSVVELIAWIFYITDTDYSFARFYFSTIGYWGTLVGYGTPVLWIILHITLEQPKSYDIVFPQAWSCYILAFSLLWWLGFGYLHMVYAPKMVAHIDALEYS